LAEYRPSSSELSVDPRRLVIASAATGAATLAIGLLIGRLIWG